MAKKIDLDAVVKVKTSFGRIECYPMFGCWHWGADSYLKGARKPFLCTIHQSRQHAILYARLKLSGPFA